LTSARICTAHLEVQPGGFLQGRVEKYVPRDVPEETSAEAKAA